MPTASRLPVVVSRKAVKAYEGFEGCVANERNYNVITSTGVNHGSHVESDTMTVSGLDCVGISVVEGLLCLCQVFGIVGYEDI